MDILSREKGEKKDKNTETQPQEEKEQEDPDCVQTKLYIWNQDQYEEFDVDYLNQVYPEKLTKLTMKSGTTFIFHFLATSLNYWVEIKDGQEDPEASSSPSKVQKLSSKDSKYIEQVLNEEGCDNYPNYNRWGKYFNKSEKFYQLMEQQSDYKIPGGGIKVHEYHRSSPKSEEGQNLETKFCIYKYQGTNKQFIEYRHKFQILFLFYIDGVSFVNQENDEWEYYIIFKEEQQATKIKYTFIGILSKFIFKITTLKRRQRISQVFVMPNYQNQGHGGELIDHVYKQCISNPICFQITTEVPSFEYQCLRDYREICLLLKGVDGQSGYINYQSIFKCSSQAQIECTQNELLDVNQIRKIKREIKIPGNQIERLVNILLYAKIIENEGSDPDCDMNKAVFEQYSRDRIIYNRSAFKSRKKLPHISFNGEVPDMKQFLLQKSKEDLLRNQEQIQQILIETIDGFRRVIRKLTKNKII